MRMYDDFQGFHLQRCELGPGLVLFHDQLLLVVWDE